MAKIDVLIPVYNAEKYIERLLSSLENQTYKDFDVVLVDDGSSDKSLEILEKIESSSKMNLSIIHQENEGAASARLTAFSHSSAPYIAYLDSDDYVDQDYLETLTKTLEETKTNIAVSRIALHPINNKHIYVMNKKATTPVVDVLHDKQKLAYMQCGTVAKLFKREFINLPEKEFNGNEDVSINYLNYALARHISFTNDTHYHYLPNNDGLTAHISGVGYEKVLKTFIPLAKLKERFEKYNLDSIYYAELEALFIRFIFQKVYDVIRLVKDKEKASNMINCLLSYLELHYPNWRENKYYISGYKGFELPDIAYCFLAKSYMRSHKIETETGTQDEIIKRYQLISKQTRR